MAELIREGIAMIASALATIITYVTFGPLINDVMSSYVLDALQDPSGALLINVQQLYDTHNIILMGIKVGFIFISFAIMARFLIYVAWKEQAQGEY